MRQQDSLNSRPGADDADFDTLTKTDQGVRQHVVHSEDQIIGQDTDGITSEGGIAIDGGKLAGNHDDFNGEVESRRLRNVPGADPNNEVHPPNDRDLRQ
jgi:hypothetical protein